MTVKTIYSIPKNLLTFLDGIAEHNELTRSAVITELISVGIDNIDDSQILELPESMEEEEAPEEEAEEEEEEPEEEEEEPEEEEEE